MITLLASRVLNAIEGGDMETTFDGGVITLLIDRKPIAPESPAPQIRITPGNSIFQPK